MENYDDTSMRLKASTAELLYLKQYKEQYRMLKYINKQMANAFNDLHNMLLFAEFKY